MDKDVVDQRLDELWQEAKAQAREAVEKAPEGQWISGSEWEVREIMQRLIQRSYQTLLQAKVDGHATADEADFSPSGADAATEPGQSPVSGAHRRRRG